MEQQSYELPRSEQGTAQPPTRSEPGHWPREQREESAQAGRPAALPTGSTGSGRPDPGPPAAEPETKRIGLIDGHMPDMVEPLVPAQPETAFTETRRLRHDGWTPEKKRLFLERVAECGVVAEGCHAAGLSARSAYNLRDRDPLFAAGWEAACVMARSRLADEAFSRSMNGVVERIYKDGTIVAERHRYDNRLTMAVLARLDARIDRAEEKRLPHLALVARWDDYLAALGEDRQEDGMALLAPPPPPPPADLQEEAGDRELHELHPEEEGEMDEDPHLVWEDNGGTWWTDYPPPAGFDGEEMGEYGDPSYRRTLSPAEQAVIDADGTDEPAGRAEALAHAEAQRDAYFSPREEEEEEEEEEEAEAPGGGAGPGG